MKSILCVAPHTALDQSALRRTPRFIGCYCALRRTPRFIGCYQVLSGVHQETLATVDRCSPHGEPSLPPPPGVFKEINQSSSL